MRIVYCYNTLWKTGGMETITAFKANALSYIDGNDVWVIVTDAPQSHQNVLSPNVHLVDLGIHYDEISSRFPFNLIRRFSKRQLHRKRLRKLFQEILPISLFRWEDTNGKYFLFCMAHGFCFVNAIPSQTYILLRKIS